MPKDSDATKGAMWEEEGRRQAYALDDCAFVMALGEKPEFAAYVALGMARVQSLRRSVYVVDCVGLIPVIDDLVPFEFRGGIPDVIIAGKALDEVAVPLEGNGKLFVLPSGATKLNHADLMANERWMRVTEELRERDALMIVVVPADEPAVQFLAPEAYGSVLVGRVRSPTGVTALASISAPVAASPLTAAARASTGIAPASGSGAVKRSTGSTKSNDLNALLIAAEQAASARPHAVRRVVGYYAPESEKKPRKTRPLIVIICVFLLALEWAIWFSRRNQPPEPETTAPAVTIQQTPVPEAVPVPPPAADTVPVAAPPP